MDALAKTGNFAHAVTFNRKFLGTPNGLRAGDPGREEFGQPRRRDVPRRSCSPTY
jgi:hypothetical protein